MYAHSHLHKHKHTIICTHTRTYAHTHTCTFARMHTRTYTHKHTLIGTHTRTYTHTNTHTHTHIRTYAHSHVHTHTHTHTHTYAHSHLHTHPHTHAHMYTHSHVPHTHTTQDFGNIAVVLFWGERIACWEILSLGTFGGPVRTEFLVEAMRSLRPAPEESVVPSATSAALPHSVQNDSPYIFWEIDIQLDPSHVLRHLQDDCVLWPVQLLPLELTHSLLSNLLSPFVDCHGAVGSHFSPMLLHIDAALSVVRLRMEQNAQLHPPCKLQVSVIGPR